MSTVMRGVAALLAAAGLIVGTPLIPITLIPAGAQERVEISAELRTALEPYGEFRQHARWGEVWVPAHVERGWEPYTVGYWVDTEDYGWYWVSDTAEAEWGWVTFHYGRWLLEPDMGWVWVPGNIWGPGFVSWRRGGHGREHYIGWAPEPPDQIIAEVRDDPHEWVFVRADDFTARRIADVVVPPPQRATLIHQTVMVNRTMFVRDRGFAVNPGISPAVVAAAAGRPIPSYLVRPVVLAGTSNIVGATTIRGEELRQDRTTIVREATAAQPIGLVRPAANIPPPEPLLANAKQGGLDVNPPRATPGETSSAAPSPTDGPNASTQQGRPTTSGGQAPSQAVDRGAEQNGSSGQERGADSQNPAQVPDEHHGATAQAPSAPREPNLGNEQPPKSLPTENHAAPHEQTSPPRGSERPRTTGAAPHKPTIGNGRRGAHGRKNHAAPHRLPRPAPARPADLRQATGR